jgi:putative membrane protein
MRGRKMKLTTLPAILAFAAIAICAPAIARSKTPAAKDQKSTAHQDTKFLEEANQGNVDEIELAQLALSKSNNDDVKNFAQRMIHDHNMLIDNMKPFANEAGVQVPSHPSVATKAEKVKLDLLSGESFDKAYIKAMVEDHSKDLQAFRAEVKATGYPAFRSAVEQGEQVVLEHLEMINQIAKKNGVKPAPVPAAGT